MKRILLFILTILGLTLTQVNAGEIERITDKGEIVVSLNKGYPPFSIVDKDKLNGLDVDLAKLIADYLGVKVKFSWGRVLPVTFSSITDVPSAFSFWNLNSAVHPDGGSIENLPV